MWHKYQSIGYKGQGQYNISVGIKIVRSCDVNGKLWAVSNFYQNGELNLNLKAAGFHPRTMH